MLSTLISHANETKVKALAALRQVFDRDDNLNETPTGIGVDRAHLEFDADVETEPRMRQVSAVRIEAWKAKDMNMLDDSWAAAEASGFKKKSLDAFRLNLHKLQGASSLYGGETLVRLTESLQKLLDATDTDPAYQQLIRVHLQACRATIFNVGNASAEASEAVCAALEQQVTRITQRGF